MSAELRQVADVFSYMIMSFNVYDVNGYRFHTTGYEQSRPNRKTTNILRQAKMGSSIMEDLKKYTNSSFKISYHWLPLFSNAIGLILH